MNFRFFADYAMNQLNYPDFETRGHTNHVTWDPAGVTGIITPWNAPLMLATWRIGPALAAGDTVVAKPPEWAPLTASLLADITVEAGMPPGVFNVVQGFGEEAGAALTAHPDISRISFTGSVPTAKLVAKAAAENLVPCSFELGGKSPLIITDDADLDIAVTVAVEQFDNAGQVCLSGTRFLVQRGIAEKFKAAFIERYAELTGTTVPSVDYPEGPATLERGRKALHDLIELHGFTKGLIFCSSDQYAQGVMIEAQARGFSVPEDIAIVGFGDQDFAAHTAPALTTVSVDRDALGRAAANALLARFRGEEGLDTVIDVGFEIVRRGSA